MSRTRPIVPNATSPNAEILSLVFALFLVLLIAGLSYRAWAAFGRASAELTTATQIMKETNALVAALTDAETGQRGFLLTGEERYLEPYRQAALRVPPALDALEAAVSNVPDQERRATQIDPLAREKLLELAQTVDLRRNGKLNEALEVVRTDRGKLAMDRIRQLSAEIQDNADTRANLFAEQSRAGANQLGLIATVGSITLFALLGISTITIHRTNVRRQRLMEALQLSEEQTTVARDWLETTLSSIGDGVIATDSEGKVVFLNPVAQELTGWSEADAAGTPLEQVFVIHHEETGAIVENPVRRALREGRIVGLANHTSLTARTGKTISIDDTAAPIRNKDGAVIGVVLVFRDVSIARERERQQERSRVALSSANKDLQQFAFAASHDLREPLRTITIFAQLLQRDATELQDANRDHLAYIVSGTDRMEQLVHALLEYSTAGADGDRSGIQVRAEQVLDDTLDNLRAAIQENHAVITRDPLPTLDVEPIHLGLVLQNLIGNAIKYRGQAPPHIHLSARKSGDEWIFSVADNGIGIQPEYHSSIFDIFKRLHTQHISGSGIGLATCRRIVERYQGRIWVESQFGHGSTFFFSVPARAPVRAKAV